MTLERKEIQKNLQERFPDMGDRVINESTDNLIAFTDFIYHMQPDATDDSRTLTNSESKDTMRDNN